MSEPVILRHQAAAQTRSIGLELLRRPEVSAVLLAKTDVPGDLEVTVEVDRLAVSFQVYRLRPLVKTYTTLVAWMSWSVVDLDTGAIDQGVADLPDVGVYADLVLSLAAGYRTASDRKRDRLQGARQFLEDL
mgnify:CR=1 FL=1